MWGPNSRTRDKPMCRALTGGFLTTWPLGKSLWLFLHFSSSRYLNRRRKKILIWIRYSSMAKTLNSCQFNVIVRIFPKVIQQLSCAAAAAKSLQSSPTLCDPVDGSPPGSSVLGFSRQEYWSRLPFLSPAFLWVKAKYLFQKLNLGYMCVCEYKYSE